MGSEDGAGLAEISAGFVNRHDVMRAPEVDRAGQSAYAGSNDNDVERHSRLFKRQKFNVLERESRKRACLYNGYQ